MESVPKKPLSFSLFCLGFCFECYNVPVNTPVKQRIGFVRVGKVTWDQRPPILTRLLDQMEVITTAPAMGDGAYLNAVDVIGLHPEFDEIELAHGDPFPHYEFTANPDGTRSRMRRVLKYPLTQVGIGDLVLEVTKRVNQEFGFGTVGINGFDLNVDTDSQLKFATIRFRNLEPEIVHLKIFEELEEGKNPIVTLENDIRDAFRRIKAGITPL